MHDKRAGQTSELATSPRNRDHQLSTYCVPPNTIDKSSNERQLFLAQQAIKLNPKLSIRAAANIFKVPRSTLGTRLNGTISRVESIPNARNLTSLEENTIVQYILDLDARLYPPRLAGVEDMANRLLADRGAPRVGKR